jgi:small subunit ribosomal protein S5
MSITRPARCVLFASISAPSRQVPTRCLHSTIRLRKDGNSVAKGLAVTPPPQISPEKQRNARIQKRLKIARRLKGYTPEEQEELAKKYSPSQMAVIEAGEASINPEDIALHGALRNDPMSLNYVDDFSKIDPVLDRQPQPKNLNWDPKLRFKESEEFADDWADFIRNLPEDADRVELQKFFDNTRMTVGKAEAELEPTDYGAPELPKLTDPIVRQQARAMARDDGTDEMRQYYDRLQKQTGMAISTMKSLRIKQMVMHRVVNQTRMGKIQSLYFLTVAGDGNGLLGIGEGKAAEPEDARRQSIMNAIRNMTPIPRYEKRTIFGDVKGKSGATELTLYHRPPGKFVSLHDRSLLTFVGFGIRTQGKIYEMCKCAGISDLAARVTRCRNPMNTIKAAFKALTSQRDPEQIARARGRKLVDLRKVYYAGNV